MWDNLRKGHIELTHRMSCIERALDSMQAGAVTEEWAMGHMKHDAISSGSQVAVRPKRRRRTAGCWSSG